MRSSCLIVVIGVWSCVYGGFLFLVSLHRLQMELRIDHYSADGPTDPTAVVFSSTCSCSSHGTVVLNPFKERLLRRRLAALVVCAHLWATNSSFQPLNTPDAAQELGGLAAEGTPPRVVIPSMLKRPLARAALPSGDS